MIVEEFMKPLGLSHTDLATMLNLEFADVDQLLAGRTDVDADMASRLGQAFQMTSEFWLNLQRSYEHDLRGTDELT